MTDEAIFSARLKELREQAGWSQKELAEKSGLNQRTISHWEQGLRDPAWTSVLALARALNVSVLAFTKPPAAATSAKRGRPKKTSG